jgi:hypothetical protein
MPAKTIYVTDANLPLFERAQEEFGESLSSLFAVFLRGELENMSEAERTLRSYLKTVRSDRAAAIKNGSRTSVSFFDETIAYLEEVLALNRKDFKSAADLWNGARNAHLISRAKDAHGEALRWDAQCRALRDSLDRLFRSEPTDVPDPKPKPEVE